MARWPVDDHNVPSVNEMISFVDEVKAWLAESEGHVIAVHCKGIRDDMIANFLDPIQDPGLN